VPSRAIIPDKGTTDAGPEGVVCLAGLEPASPFRRTRPSTWRVYRFTTSTRSRYTESNRAMRRTKAQPHRAHRRSWGTRTRTWTLLGQNQTCCPITPFPINLADPDLGQKATFFGHARLLCVLSGAMRRKVHTTMNSRQHCLIWRPAVRRGASRARGGIRTHSTPLFESSRSSGCLLARTSPET
jgi:hypothetical protein